MKEAIIFSLGDYKLGILGGWHFKAHNKIIIEKQGNIKTFKNYIFGETSRTGGSILYTCTQETLNSSIKTISEDKREITGFHWFSFHVAIIYEQYPIAEDNERGISFYRSIQKY